MSVSQSHMRKISTGHWNTCTVVASAAYTKVSSSSKWMSLLTFVVLHAFLSIGLRFDAMHADISNAPMASTIVCMTEVTKLLFSLILAISVDCRGNTFLFLHHLENAFVEDAADLLKLFVPAILYNIQNNLQYVIETSTLFVVMYVRESS